MSMTARLGNNRGATLCRWLLLAAVLAFLGCFYLYPMVRIIGLSLSPAGDIEPLGLLRRLFSPVYGRVIWFSCWQAALSTLLTLVLALPAAWIFARFTFAGKGLLQAAMTVPFVLPTVVAAAGFQALLGSNGLVNQWLIEGFGLSSPPIRLDQTLWFFLLAHVFYNYSLVVRVVGGYWAALDPRLPAAARMLGASPWQTFRRITLPLLLPAIGSASLLIFIFCFTSFGVVLILGGPGYATIEVEIYRQAVQLFNLPMAAVLSLVQIGINFLLMLVYARLEQRSNTSLASVTGEGSAIPASGKREQLLIGANLLVMTALLLSPLLALVVRSFVGVHGPTLVYYSALFSRQARSVFAVEPIAAVTNSFSFALATMLLAVLLGLAAATFIGRDSRQRQVFWDGVIMLPLATSAVTLGFGYIIALNRPPLNLRDSLALIPLAHTLVAFPLVLRCILPALRQVPQSLREAAALLGAPPATVWRLIDLPLISRAILVGAVFAFSISLGEFGASSFIARPHMPTMPVAIFRFLGQPGEMNYGQAMAMSTILMAVTCSGFWLIDRLGYFSRRPGSLPR